MRYPLQAGIFVSAQEGAFVWCRESGLSMFYAQAEYEASMAHRDQDASAAIVKVPWEGHCQDGSSIGTMKGYQKKILILK